MLKYWINENAGADRIIAVNETALCKSMGSTKSIDADIVDIKNNIIPTTMFSIPFSYLKQIVADTNKDRIDIFFGQDSEEILKIKDQTLRNEIFTFLKNHIPGANYQFEKYSGLKAATKPLIAFAVMLGIFIWAADVATEVNSGGDNSLNASGRSLSSVILVLASLGIHWLRIIFGAILTLCAFSIFVKIKNRPSKEILNFRNK